MIAILFVSIHLYVEPKWAGLCLPKVASYWPITIELHFTFLTHINELSSVFSLLFIKYFGVHFQINKYSLDRS